MVKFIVYQETPEISGQELITKINEVKNSYCFSELEDKVKEIFEERERLNNQNNNEEIKDEVR